MPITPDDDTTTNDDDAFDPAPQTQDDLPARDFSDMVRESPIGAVVGAFIAGFLVSKFL